MSSTVRRCSKEVAPGTIVSRRRRKKRSPAMSQPSLWACDQGKGSYEGAGQRGSSGVKPRGCPGIKAKGSPGVTSHTPGSVKSVRKCEGVNPHTPKANSHFGRWSPGGLPKLQRAIAGVKPQCIVAFFISLESS